MKRIWIKLFIEVLDDPKMGRLPDWLWRRAIELFLLAGENGNDGLLQPVMDMAWRLRTSIEKLTESLQALSQVGVVHETPSGWVVTHFQERQAAMTVAERQAEYRKRHSNKKVTKDVTESDKAVVTDSTSTSDSVSLEREGVGEKTKNVFALYEENIGPLTPMLADTLDDAEKTYTLSWVVDAIALAVENNKRNWRYCEAILKRWQRDGKDNGRRPPPNGVQDYEQALQKAGYK